jgi:hypothetical protein
LLFLPVFENAKILLRQIADGMPVFIVDAHFHQDQVYVHFEGNHTRRRSNGRAARGGRCALCAQSQTTTEQQEYKAPEFYPLIHFLS